MGRKAKNCSRIKNRTVRLAVRKNDVLETWLKYFEDQYNVDTEKQVTVNM